jgi:hypothetical protein
VLAALANVVLSSGMRPIGIGASCGNAETPIRFTPASCTSCEIQIQDGGVRDSGDRWVYT